MKRIQQHPQYNKQLFVWHGINDMELQYSYKNSKALVFPSQVEGFGLPIIEALQNHLPVIASDIPIHREIGGEIAQYVGIDNPQNLVNLISEIESSGIDKKHQPDDDYHWLSWKEATEQLLHKLVKMKQTAYPPHLYPI